MKASELRIGNYHYYTCEDSLDERKKWDEFCQIDSQDLVWLESNPDDEDFKPIPITEEWLFKFGFKKANKDDSFGGYLSPEMPNGSKIRIKNNEWSSQHCSAKIEYVHQLQNLYFALTETELSLNEKSE